MNISRPFILRPVATALLMAALLLSGMLAYRLLPVSALPQVDYPTIRDPHLLSGRQPGGDDQRGDGAARAPVRPDAGPRPDVVHQLGRRVGDHAALRAREAARASPSRKCRRRSTPPTACCPNDLPQPPVYNKVNPADTPVLTLAVTSQDGAAAAGARPGRHARGAEAVAAARRRPGQHRRRPAAGRAHPGQPAGAGRARPEPADAARGRSPRANVNQPKGNFDGPERSFMLDANDQLRSPEAYQRPDRRLPRRRAAAAVATSPTSSTAPRTAACRRGPTSCRRCWSTSSASPAPTSSTSSTASSALLPQLTASLPSTLDGGRHQRPHRDHPRLGARRAARADLRRRRWSCW